MHILDFVSKERHLLVLTFVSKSMMQCMLHSSSVSKDEVLTDSVLIGDGLSCHSLDTVLYANFYK